MYVSFAVQAQSGFAPIWVIMWPCDITRPECLKLILGMVFLLLFAAQFGVLVVQTRRLSKFSVEVSDQGVRVGDASVKWSDIEDVEHARRTIGLAFRISMRDGRRLDVHSGLENSQELEDLIKSKLSG